MLRLRNEQLDLTLLLGIARERVERHEKLATSRARLPSRRERPRPQAPGHTSECVCGKGPPPFSRPATVERRRFRRPTALRAALATADITKRRCPPQVGPVGRVIPTATVLLLVLPREWVGVYKTPTHVRMTSAGRQVSGMPGLHGVSCSQQAGARQPYGRVGRRCGAAATRVRVRPSSDVEDELVRARAHRGGA